MDGRCNSCASKFGLFKKEHGCKNCGFSFCKSCLPHEIAIPNKGPKFQAVCRNCYKLLTVPPDKKQDSAKYSPPENFKRRVAALKEKEMGQHEPSSTKPDGSPQVQRIDPTFKNLAPQDRALAERLEKLKEDRRKEGGPVATTEEMEKRLRALRDLPTDSPAPKSGIDMKPDTRSNQEKTNDLLSQLKDEVNLDVKHEDGAAASSAIDTIPDDGIFKTPEEEMNTVIEGAKHDLRMEAEGRSKDEEMEERLAKLHGMDLKTYRDKGLQEQEELSEEEATRRYIAQLLAEERLDSKVAQDGYADMLSNTKGHSENQKPAVDPDELPWCCICNDDATLCCHGCDEDLYCKRCFKEGHDDFDLKDHRTSTYRPPKDVDR